MPSRSKKPCSAPRCPNLTTGKYCEAHAHIEKKAAAERDQYYDRFQRDPRITAFYKSGGWQAARRAALIRDHGLCQPCLRRDKLTKAVIVHHVIEIETEKAGRSVYGFPTWRVSVEHVIIRFTK